MLIITTTAQLKNLVPVLKKEQVLAIDTEFVRRDTYYAKLGLIQIASNKETFIIDPLGLELSHFSEILSDKNIVKIFHDPTQDIAIFYNILGIYTSNVFDTQEAVKFCGIKHQISYQQLCSKIIGVEIEKQQKFRNWLERPLPQEMLEYASQDVAHLIPIYEKLVNEMRAYHNIEKFYQTMDIYNQKDFYLPNLERIWLKIRTTEKSESFFQKLQMIAAFREIAAMQLDVPRQHAICDDDVILVAKYLPSTTEEFRKLKIRSRLSKEQQEELFELCLGIQEISEIM